MLNRRRFQLIVLFAAAITKSYAQDANEITVSIRVDETARSVLSPIQERNLTIKPDNSDIARDLIRRIPPGRALPVMVIIIGAIALVDLFRMIRELYRQTYYGGVMIDTRTKPASVTSDPKIPSDMVFVIDESGKIQTYSSNDFTIDTLKIALGAR